VGRVTNVIQMDVLRQEYNEEKQQSQAHKSSEGFSDRFNELIDQVQDLGIPARDVRGRQSKIAKMTGHSKPSVSDWLAKDKLPNDEIFPSLIRFFLHHTPYSLNALRVESWLRYGEEATPNPFTLDEHQEETEALNLIAFQLLTDTVKEKQIGVSSYDMQAVLDDIYDVLKSFGVQPGDEVPKPLTKLVSTFITKHSKL